MIDHSHLTHGCRPGRYREHDPRDRIYEVIRDLGSSVSPVSKGLFSLFVKRNSRWLFKCVTLPTPSEKVLRNFQEKNSCKTQEKKYCYVNPVFLVGMLFHCRSWAKIFGNSLIMLRKTALIFLFATDEPSNPFVRYYWKRWNFPFISDVGIIIYHKSDRYSLYVRPKIKALHSVRDQLSGGRWR